MRHAFVRNPGVDHSSLRFGQAQADQRAVNNRQTHALVSQYLASGGCVRKIPEAVPVTEVEVLQYLETRDVHVQIVAGRHPSEGRKYRRDGDRLAWAAVMKLANGHRRRQRLPPFR